MVIEPVVLAIIPAYRPNTTGDQRYIQTLNGDPLIAYSVAAAQQSELISYTIVVAKDAAVASLARDCGATSYLLPTENPNWSLDTATIQQFVLAKLAELGYAKPGIVAWLHPFAPLRPPHCVDQAIELLLENPHAQSVHSVVPAGPVIVAAWQNDFSNEASQQSILSAPAFPTLDGPDVNLQTRHISVFRITSKDQGAMGENAASLPLVLDPSYNVDISAPLGWEWAEWIIRHARLDIVRPGRQPRRLPQHVKLLVLDFDGVFTDNRVWVDDQGHELVAAHRGDSLGLNRLRKSGVEVLVLSTETNPVVAQRCRKLDLPVIQGVDDKAAALTSLLAARGVEAGQVLYLGNDVNDLPCFPIVGCAVVPADAHHNVLHQADLVLKHKGGKGAIRELCDLLLGED